MSYESYCDQGGTGVAVRDRRESVSKLTDVQEARSTSYDLPYHKSGTVQSNRATARAKPQTKQVPPASPARWDAVRREIERAERETALMVAAATAGDLIELSNAGFRVVGALEELWRFRSERESDWGDLLNVLQIVLAQVEFERFSPAQCHAIRDFITQCLSAGVVDRDDMEAGIRLLRNAGFDPWKGISATKESV